MVLRLKSRRFMVMAFVLTCMVMLASALPAWAAKEPVTVEADILVFAPPSTRLPAGDDPQHFVILGQRSGDAVFSDGGKAKYSNVFFMDLFPGHFVKVQGYTKLAFADGSWMFFRWQSSFDHRDESGIPVFAGTGELESGGGRYKGIKGKVEFTSRALPATKDRPQSGNKAKAKFTYVLP